MGYIVKYDGWENSIFHVRRDKEIIQKPIDNHSLKCHKQRIDNRKVMNGIFLF